MHTIARWSPRRLLTAITAMILTACSADTPAAPDAASAPAARLGRAPDLAGCDSLQAPGASVLTLHVYATGVQIYRWSGAAWVFVAPQAELFADAGHAARIGSHYAGPTWASLDGSTVVGAVQKRCPAPLPGAIPWLLLGAASHDGAGVFRDVAFIQRVNTVGGIAPADPGAAVGELRDVPYSAEYFFWRDR